MRVTADTNTVISGSLWHGNPRRVLDAARDGLIELYTSRPLLAELEDVLHRERFAHRLSLANRTAKELVRNYSFVATVIEAEPIEPTIIRDPDAMRFWPVLYRPSARSLFPEITTYSTSKNIAEFAFFRRRSYLLNFICRPKLPFRA